MSSEIKQMKVKVFGLFLFCKRVSADDFENVTFSIKNQENPLRIVAEEQETAIQVFCHLHNKTKWSELSNEYFFTKVYSFKKVGNLIEKI